MKTARLVLKIVGGALALAGCVCLVLGFCSKLLEFLSQPRA